MGSEHGHYTWAMEMSNVHGYYLHHQELIQATLLLRLANGLLGALSGCAGNGMCDYMDQKKFLQV